MDFSGSGRNSNRSLKSETLSILLHLEMLGTLLRIKSFTFDSASSKRELVLGVGSVVGQRTFRVCIFEITKLIDAVQKLEEG